MFLISKKVPVLFFLSKERPPEADLKSAAQNGSLIFIFYPLALRQALCDYSLPPNDCLPRRLVLRSFNEEGSFLAKAGRLMPVTYSDAND